MKLYRRSLVEEVLQILAQNVRVPDQVLGDINAQIGAAGSGRAACGAAGGGGTDRSPRSRRGSVWRSEQAMRAAIQRVPDGVYKNAVMMDGFDEPLVIKLKLTGPGDTLDYDFEGTSAQINKGINSCYNYTYGYAAFAAKAVLEPLFRTTKALIGRYVEGTGGVAGQFDPARAG